jgi:hypothetical protein
MKAVNILFQITYKDNDKNKSYMKMAASELGPEFKLTTLVGSQIILSNTLIGS